VNALAVHAALVKPFADAAAAAAAHTQVVSAKIDHLSRIRALP